MYIITQFCKLIKRYPPPHLWQKKQFLISIRIIEWLSFKNRSMLSYHPNFEKLVHCVNIKESEQSLKKRQVTDLCIIKQYQPTLLNKQDCKYN